MTNNCVSLLGSDDNWTDIFRLMLCSIFFPSFSDLFFQQIETAASERERLLLLKISELQFRSVS